ncbi:hypothetical protein KQX54_008844 [Cotesia glomerata]|uniref:Uncharacterized protein n=1 Tax=Cotesia glomerata TaxID=32391 RepID=A0AAV7IZJ1_COTGL|nr:hypothetical protein KQX54_008844 [Cotesia glomerata]
MRGISELRMNIWPFRFFAFHHLNILPLRVSKFLILRKFHLPILDRELFFIADRSSVNLRFRQRKARALRYQQTLEEEALLSQHWRELYQNSFPWKKAPLTVLPLKNPRYP